MIGGKMRKRVVASAALPFVLLLGLSAAEAPKKGAAPDAALAAAKADLERHIRVLARENEALYPIQDDELIEMRYLEFKVVQSTPVARPASDRLILRAEFVERGDPEFGEKDVPIFVDFGLRKEKKEWKVSDKAIYSEDGEARFRYTERFERAPLNPPLRPEAADPGDQGLGEPSVPPRGDLDEGEERRGT